MSRYSRDYYESDAFRGLYSLFSGRYSWLSEDMFRSLWDLDVFGADYARDGLFSGHTDWKVSDEAAPWFNWYGGYLSKIAQYKGTDYYQQLLNNPYASYQAGLSQTDWNERFNSADAEMYKILGTMQQNSYNSTAAAAARDKQAGFNDALSGQLAGTPAAADNAPSDARPSAGVSDDAKLQADVQERQNSFDRALRIASLPLDILASVSGGMTAFAGLMKMPAEFANLSAGAAASDAAAGLSQAQTAGQVAQNQNAWRGQFLDTLLGGADLASGTVDMADRLSKFDKSSLSPEQAEYFDSLVNSGYFIGSDGKPSAAALQDYSARLSGTAGNMERAGMSLGRLGGSSALSDPSGALDYIFSLYGDYEIDMMKAELEGQRIENSLAVAQSELVSAQEEKTRLESINVGLEGDILSAQSDEAESQASIAAVDARIKEYSEKTQQLQIDLQNHAMKVQKLENDAFQGILDKASSTRNPFVKFGAVRLIRTGKQSSQGFQQRFDRGLNNLGKVANIVPSDSSK